MDHSEPGRSGTRGCSRLKWALTSSDAELLTALNPLAPAAVAPAGIRRALAPSHTMDSYPTSTGPLWRKPVGKKSPEFVSSSCIEFRLTSLFPSCFLLLGFFSFKCVCLIVCGCMHAWVCARALPAEVRRGHQPSPGVEVTGDCELPCRCEILCKKTKCSYRLSNLCEPRAQILHTLLSSVNEFLLYWQRGF